MPDITIASLLREFITLFVVIDPIGTLPVFYFASQGVPEHLHWRLASRAVLVAAVVLLLFLIGGQVMIEAVGLRLGSFQIAGGIVLFLFALTMIFGEPKAMREIEEAERDHMAGAVFPLAMPSIASPGALLAVVILTDNHGHSIPDQAVTGFLLLLVLLITLALLLVATRLKRVIGQTGANAISRVMGIILATVAVDSILNGFQLVGVLNLD
ncbi:MarC family protein [Aquicoccus sp. G2-2]|jgi:multiple antibiotic resistance protein|uniref:MarC family protein n=1 Tax=Aquicoccus sp. G2-2 TaxID=3092120 RepID=UPI002AE097D5|nr:MarC family protein [Aquicoccus sp. G2-2]MEA1114219.1 MarC family protein [Aquicoccus sp. G2-2]